MAGRIGRFVDDVRRSHGLSELTLRLTPAQRRATLAHGHTTLRTTAVVTATDARGRATTVRRRVTIRLR